MAPPDYLPNLETDVTRVAALALVEDGEVDVTTEVTEAAGVLATGSVQYRAGGAVAGTRYAEAVAGLCGCSDVQWAVVDGAVVSPSTTIGWIRGDLAHILRAERPLLNILQRACGIATATRAFVDALADTGCSVLHTRKTAPGLRGLDVRAVLAGGGMLHRVDLRHQVLIKDNHWSVLARRRGALRAALDAARARGITELYVEVESLAQVEEACAAGATRLLVDNQSPKTFRRWADVARGLVPDIELEATGGITLDSVRDYALSGADFVSIGALTNSVLAADLALEVQQA